MLYSNIAVLTYLVGMDDKAVIVALAAFLPFLLCVIFHSRR